DGHEEHDGLLAEASLNEEAIRRVLRARRGAYYLSMPIAASTLNGNELLTRDTSADGSYLSLTPRLGLGAVVNGPRAELLARETVGGVGRLQLAIDGDAVVEDEALARVV